MRAWVWVLGATAAWATVIACVGSDPTIPSDDGSLDASTHNDGASTTTTNDGATSTTDDDAGDAGPRCGFPGEACCTGPFAACNAGTTCGDAGLCMVNDVWVVGAEVSFSDLQYHGFSAHYGGVGDGWDAGPGMSADGGTIPYGVWLPQPGQPIVVERYGHSPYQGRVLEVPQTSSWQTCGSFACATPPTTKSFYTIYGFGAGDYWIAAEDAMYQCNGATCASKSTGLPAAIGQYNFSGTSSSDLWYSSFDKVYHYDGTSWTATSNLKAYRVFARATDDVWVGDTTLQHFDGHSWSQEYSVSGAAAPGTIFGMSGSGKNDIWAVGYLGSDGAHPSYSAHWDGAQWTLVPLPAGAKSVTSIWAPSPIEAFAASEEDGTLYKWDGTAWSIMHRPTAPDGGYIGGGWEAMHGSAKPRP